MMKLFSAQLLRLFVSVFLFSTAFGMIVVIFPAKLLENKIGAAQIGFASAFEVMSGIFMSFFLAQFIKKNGVKKSLFLSSLTYAVAILVIFFCKNFYLWLFVVFFTGCCWIINTITRQAWIHSIVDSKNRGIMTGIYSTIISVGLACGPLLVKPLGAENYYSFILSSAFIFVAFLILGEEKKLQEMQFESKKMPLKVFFKTSPRSFMARFFFDLISFSILSFSVVFGKKIGLSAENAGLLITAFMASFFFDLVTGMLLKKYNPHKLINIGFVGFLTSMIIIALYHSSYALLLVLFFIMGIFAALIYVSVMVAVNNDYKKEELVAANATMQIVGSSGSLAAGLLNGILINIFSATGFIITIILSCVCFLTFLVFYEKRNSFRR